MFLEINVSAEFLVFIGFIDLKARREQNYKIILNVIGNKIITKINEQVRKKNFI